MDSFEKQAYEEFTITADFSANLETGETITAQTVTAIDKNSDDVTDTITDQSSIASSGSQVSVLVRSGEQDLSSYKITFRCTTSNSHKWELDVKMKVKEI